MRIFGVILAGGAGRRMGGADKALLHLGGLPLLRHAIDRLEPQVEALMLSANGDAARFAGFGLPVLPDAIPQGPLSGVLTALEWATTRGATAVVSVAVDTPFFPGDLVPRLCLAAESAPEGLAVVEAGGRRHPTFTLWPATLATALRAHLASGAPPRVMDFVAAHLAVPALFPDDGSFANLNTPDDLSAAEALLSGP